MRPNNLKKYKSYSYPNPYIIRHSQPQNMFFTPPHIQQNQLPLEIRFKDKINRLICETETALDDYSESSNYEKQNIRNALYYIKDNIPDNDPSLKPLIEIALHPKGKNNSHLYTDFMNLYLLDPKLTIEIFTKCSKTLDTEFVLYPFIHALGNMADRHNGEKDIINKLLRIISFDQIKLVGSNKKTLGKANRAVQIITLAQNIRPEPLRIILKTYLYKTNEALINKLFETNIWLTAQDRLQEDTLDQYWPQENVKRGKILDQAKNMLDINMALGQQDDNSIDVLCDILQEIKN